MKPADFLAEGAAAILAAGEPAEKVALSRALATRWRAGGMTVGNASFTYRVGDIEAVDVANGSRYRRSKSRTVRPCHFRSRRVFTPSRSTRSRYRDR